jgi:hypothetical protein
MSRPGVRCLVAPEASSFSGECATATELHLPMALALAVSKRNQPDPHGDLWMQPMRFGS